MQRGLKVRLAAGGTVTLSPQTFVASGGEGSVYARGKIAYKIYDDPARAIGRSKLEELGRIAHPAVLTPTDLLLREADGAPIGYAMPYCPDAWVLTQLVPSAFWARHGLGPHDALSIAWRLRDAMVAVHAAGCCVADLSSMNVLVTPGTLAPVLVDTDSFQTPSHPATAITPEIRDPRASATAFAPASDWFSLAVIAFELFVGIHPFKGKHPRIRGLVERMRAGVSVLDPEVSCPAACRPVAHVPPAWRAWFRDVFEAGHRGPPPGSGSIASAHRNGAPGLVAHARLPDGARMQVRIDMTAGVVSLHASRVVTPATLALRPRAMLEVEGHVMLLHDDALVRLDPVLVGDRVFVGIVPVASVMPHATTLWPGLALQDVLGRAHALLLDRHGHARPLRLPALDGSAIVDAAHHDGVVVVVVRDGSRLHRLTFLAEHEAHAAPARIEADVPTAAVGSVPPRQTISASPARFAANPAKPGP